MTRGTYGEGSVRKRSAGTYEIRWSAGRDTFTGELMYRSTTVRVNTITEARKELRLRVAADRRDSRVTVRELIDLTLPELPIADASRERYRYALNHFPEVAGAWQAVDLTPRDARRVIDGLAERHGPQTVRKCYTALMSCWKQARLNGWVTDNPWAGQRLPKIKRSAGVPLTDDEAKALMGALEPGVEECWITIHLATGARPGEVVGLRRSSVDLSDSTITFIDAKHDGEPRTVAIDSHTERVVGDWIAEQDEVSASLALPLADDPFLITSEPDASKPWRRDYASRFRWYKVRAAAGLRDDLRLYDLRHTSNSWLAAAGFSSEDRGQRAGNSPATNQRVYTHSMRDREAAATIGERLSGR